MTRLSPLQETLMTNLWGSRTFAIGAHESLSLSLAINGSIERGGEMPGPVVASPVGDLHIALTVSTTSVETVRKAEGGLLRKAIYHYTVTNHHSSAQAFDVFYLFDDDS